MTLSLSLSPSEHPAGPRIGWSAFDAAVPGAFAALRALSQSVEAAGLDKRLAELVKVRVSQINGCAFCLKLHLDWAREAGVPAVQLDLLSAWRDADGFDPAQRAALAWAERLTRMAEHHVEDACYAEARRHFPDAELAALTTAVAGINAWNRIAGALRFVPPGMAAARKPEA